MEVIISIVGALASKAAEYTVDPAARQLNYLFKPKTNFQNLCTKVQDLKDARERLQQSVEAATRNGEVIFDDVKRWLADVNEKISEQAGAQLRKDEEKATKRCLVGFCPDFKSSYHISKKADREANVIEQLLIKKDAFKAVGYHPAVQVTDIIRPVKDYEAFGSRSGAFDELMNALEDDDASIIGVYGMGGVGKTTLVKEVARRAKEKLSFNEVVFVAVTQTSNTVKIQNDIADQLGKKLDYDVVDLRAAQLRDRLKNAKKVLVILDDIWEKQEVDTIGIPSADEHKGCKILMTSRSLDVLKRMDSRHNISIETLKEDEALNLFKKMAGQIVERFDLQSIAVEVAKKCAGLPIAIATIANALKPKENLCEWEDALRQLSNPSGRNFEDIPGEAYSAIELSYKLLEVKEHGPIFLLCSIMGHDAAVEDLLRYAIGLGFIHDVSSIKESRNRVLTLVNNLKASSLLLKGSNPNLFDMHDVVRDVAQSIASRDLHWLALFKKWPDEEKMKERQLISLQNVQVSELLHHELDCPNLTYFSIGMEYYSSLNISNNFFKGMQRFKVLEFNRIKFTSLPSSISSLKTLCTLSLRDCGLEDISILGELGNLEILDLRGSTMEMLPKEIGQLTRLKLLDLSDCYDLEVISPNVLSKLSRLEELYLYHSFDKWKVEGIENPRSNVSLVELQHLSRLTTLEVHIPEVDAIPKDNLFFGKMERYKISIGDEKWSVYSDTAMETSRMLKVRVNKSIQLVDGIKHLLGKTQSLYLDGMEDVEEMQMLYNPNIESFGQLRFIKVKNCNLLQNLFSFSMVKRLCQLEELEVSECKNIAGLIVEKEEIDENDILEFNKLFILKLDQLKRFSGLQYSENMLQSSACLFDKKVSCPVLKRLELSGCHTLKYVFTSSMVKSFVELETLQVCNCHEMEGVIEGTLAAEEGIISNIRLFPKLVFMTLRLLPKLRRFCCEINCIEFPSLKFLDIWECSALNTFTFNDGKSRVTPPRYLFNEKVILPALEDLDIREMGNLERLWAHKLVEHSFSKLTSIRIERCPELMNVFPLSMLTRLQRLNRLSIYECKSVEEIIFGPNSQSQERGSSSSSGMPLQFIQSDVISFEFPNLTSLVLDDLPNLKSIHHNKMLTINWPSLNKLEVHRCHRVEILFASSETTSEQPLFWVNESTLSNLHQLTLGWNAGIKDIIWHCQGQQQQILFSLYFPNLKVVELYSYPKQATLLPSCLFHLLSHIIELRLHSLPELVHLWKEMEGYPNIRILHVFRCIKLKVNLVPSLVSFRNLVTLKVEECDGIIRLITPSTAKSLVQLKQMSIIRCQRMEEIILGGDDDDDDDDNDDDRISFPKLNSLEFYDLQRLESFCSSKKYTFEFPSLEFLVVDECPKMKMFSQGHSNTPLLHKVRINVSRDDERWEGSLDSTIRKLFREENTTVWECVTFEEDQSTSSTSSIQNLAAEVENSSISNYE